MATASRSTWLHLGPPAAVGVAALLAGVLWWVRARGADTALFAVADRGDDAVHLLDGRLLLRRSFAVTAPVALLRVQGRSDGALLLVASALERRPDGAHALVALSLTSAPAHLPPAASGEFEGPVELFREGSTWGVVERAGRGGERRIVLGRDGGRDSAWDTARSGGEARDRGGWWLEAGTGWLRSPAGLWEQLAGFEGEGALVPLERGALIWAPGHVVRCDRRGLPSAGQGGFSHLSAALPLGELQE